MSEQPSVAPGARLEDAAVELTRRWVQEEASIPVDPAAQRLAGVLRLVPRGWRDAAYRALARNRYRWFGRHDTCHLPAPEQAARFLD